VFVTISLFAPDAPRLQARMRPMSNTIVPMPMHERFIATSFAAASPFGEANRAFEDDRQIDEIRVNNM
jgi:hypothetical protein